MRHIVKPFEELRAGGYSVTPLVADHSETEQCLIYVVLDRGKTILHGTIPSGFPTRLGIISRVLNRILRYWIAHMVLCLESSITRV